MYMKKLIKLNSGLSQNKAFTQKELKTIDKTLATFCKTNNILNDSDDMISIIFSYCVAHKKKIQSPTYYAKIIESNILNIYKKEAYKFNYIVSDNYYYMNDAKIDLYNIINHLKKTNQSRMLYHLLGTIEYVLTSPNPKSDTQIVKADVIRHLKTTKEKYNYDMKKVKEIYYGRK